MFKTHSGKWRDHVGISDPYYSFFTVPCVFVEVEVEGKRGGGWRICARLFGTCLSYGNNEEHESKLNTVTCANEAD